MKNEFDFYKTQGTWFIDLPSYPGDVADLAMVLGADVMLDELAGSNHHVSLMISDTIFENASVLVKDFDLKLVPDELHETAREMGGDFYISESNKSVWLCDVTKYVFASMTMPDAIWYSKIEDEE